MNTLSGTRRLSVAVIVRDAAEPLRLTLASIRDVADEIVVVDTGSTDKSSEVAREFGARVFPFEWCDDFSAARNFALQNVTCEWVFWLDAGETLGADAASGLRQFVETQAKQNHAYAFLVRVPTLVPQGSDEQIARVRLVPNQPGVAFSGRVRETLAPSLVTLGFQVEGTPLLIRRGEREHDLRIKKQRAQRNIRLSERELRENASPDSAARLWNCLGESFQTLADRPRTIECFRQAIGVSERGSLDMLEAYYGLLTSLDSNEDRGAQLSLCVQAIEIFPLDAQLLCALGGYLHANGEQALAEKSYLTCYEYGQIQPTVWHLADIREIGASCYSISLQLQNKTEEAIQFLESALRDRPDSTKLRRRMIEACINGGHRDAALAHVNALPKTIPHLEAFRSAVRGACYAVQKNWLAAKAYLHAAHNHGCNEVICLKWLTISLLACGDAQAARPILAQWQALEPNNPDAAKLAAALAAAPKATPGDRNLRVDTAPSAASSGPLPLKISPSASSSSQIAK